MVPDERQSRTVYEKINIRNGSAGKGVTRVMSFTSGKGGVGKTNTVINLAIALARQGKSVLLLDADLGLANIDVMLGIHTKYTLQDVLEGRKTLEEVMLTGPEGIRIIPAASGVETICSLDTGQRLLLIEAVETVASQFDYLLIDTRAGIDSDVMYFNSASSEVVCIINPEPTSLTDAYALIKVLSKNYGERRISVVANNCANEREAMKAFGRLEKAVQRFLQVELRYLGFIPTDASVREAIQEQRALVDIYPTSHAGLALMSMARRIDDSFHELRVKGGMQFFFKQLLEAGSHGV